MERLDAEPGARSPAWPARRRLVADVVNGEDTLRRAEDSVSSIRGAQQQRANAVCQSFECYDLRAKAMRWQHSERGSVRAGSRRARRVRRIDARAVEERGTVDEIYPQRRIRHAGGLHVVANSCTPTRTVRPCRKSTGAVHALQFHLPCSGTNTRRSCPRRARWRVSAARRRPVAGLRKGNTRQRGSRCAAASVKFATARSGWRD